MKREVKRLWKDSTKEQCEGFAKALGKGLSPRIEDYLVRVAASDRRAAFYGLLTREIDFLESADRSVDLALYRTRFADDADIVEAVLFRGEQLETCLTECGYELVGLLATRRTGDLYKVKNTESGSYESLTLIPSFLVRSKSRHAGEFDFDYLYHPGIVRPTNVIEAGADILLFGEFIDGPDFSDLAEAGRTPIRAAAELMRQAADAVTWLHTHDRVHGTLSPTSFSVVVQPDKSHRVKLCGAPFYQLADASLSRFRAPSLQEFNWKIFVPPENERDVTQVQSAGDVFSLGQIFLYLISEEPNRSLVRSSTWAASRLTEFRAAVVSDSCPLNAEEAKQLVDLISAAVSENPDERPDTLSLKAGFAQISESTGLNSTVISAKKHQATSDATRRRIAPTTDSDSAGSASEYSENRSKLSRASWTGIAIGGVLAMLLILEAVRIFVAADHDIAIVSTGDDIVTATPTDEGIQERGDRRVRPKSDPEVAAVRRPSLYMLSIGVSKYQDEQYNLSVADSDARELAATFKDTEGGIFGDVEVRTLTNEQADKNGILHELKWLQSEATQNDLAVVTVSGHGVTDEFDDFFFLPHDYDSTKEMSYAAVSWDDFRRRLTRMPCVVLLVMDTCHSGGVTRLGMRGVQHLEMDRAAKKAIQAFSDTQSGLVIMAASLGEQTALEKTDWGHGAMTLALLEGLTGVHKTEIENNTPLPHADDDDGIISLGELSYYVTKRVKALTDGKQAVVTNHSGNIDMDVIPLHTVAKSPE